MELSAGVASSLPEFVVRLVCTLGTVAVGLLSVLVGFLYVKQDKLLYMPAIGHFARRPQSNAKGYRSPDEYDVPFETHMIRCEDGVTIHSWLLLHPNAKIDKLPTIMFFHAKLGNIGLRLPNATQMYKILNANIMLVEYRGYGDSDETSKPSEAGLKLDAEAALRFLSSYHDAIDTTCIFAFGRSLGGAVAFHMAQYAEQNSLPLAGVIVENTFLSISHIVDHLYPWYIAPLKWLILRIGWNSYRIVPHLKVPVLYLAGAADEEVPLWHMMELYNLSSKSSRCARIHVVKDGTHNETWLQGGREYWNKIQNFISEALESHVLGAEDPKKKNV